MGNVQVTSSSVLIGKRPSWPSWSRPVAGEGPSANWALLFVCLARSIITLRDHGAVETPTARRYRLRMTSSREPIGQVRFKRLADSAQEGDFAGITGLRESRSPARRGTSLLPAPAARSLALNSTCCRERRPSNSSSATKESSAPPASCTCPCASTHLRFTGGLDRRRACCHASSSSSGTPRLGRQDTPRRLYDWRAWVVVWQSREREGKGCSGRTGLTLLVMQATLATRGRPPRARRTSR